MFSNRETQTQVGESQPDSPVLGKEFNALLNLSLQSKTWP